MNYLQPQAHIIAQQYIKKLTKKTRKLYTRTLFWSDMPLENTL